MNKTIGIFQFSGTGNTELAADRYAREFRARGFPAIVEKMEDYVRAGKQPDVSKYALVGFGYPIHAWNAPKIVFDFINLIDGTAKDRKAFLFKCPGDLMAEGGSTLPVRALLRKKGFEVLHEGMLVMPANLGCRYPAALEKELYIIACSRINRFARDLIDGKTVLQSNTRAQKLMTMISVFEQFGARMLKLHFRVKKTCTGCGLCAKQCPSGNITMKNRRPVFGWRCLACMRCIYRCPVQAIGWLGLNKVIFKQGYDLRKIVDDPDVQSTFLRRGMEGYYSRFVEYAGDQLQVPGRPREDDSGDFRPGGDRRGGGGRGGDRRGGDRRGGGRDRGPRRDGGGGRRGGRPRR